MKYTSLLFSFVLVVLSFTSQNTQSEMLALYNERPPYMLGDNKGHVSGLTASVADYALRKAGIPFQWREVPSQRQMQYLRENQVEVAAVGWFKNAERESFCKFSIPLYKDKEIVLLAKSRNEKVSKHKALDSLFLDKNLVLLLKKGYSYGKFIDDKIRKSSIRKFSTTGENFQMIKMIYMGRADCMFIAHEEADYVIEYAGLNTTDFKIISLTDIPEGEYRHILFSKRVDDRIISKVNKYILEYQRLNLE